MWRWIVLTAFFGLSYAQNVTNFPNHVILHNGCGSTFKNEWSCCVSAFNASVCIKLRYLREAMGFELLVTVNDYTYIDEEISVRNPPPICVKVPYLRELLGLCVILHDINLTKKDLSGCIYFEAQFFEFKIANIKLGCFDFPLEKQEMMKLKKFMLKQINEIQHISVNLVT